MHMCRCKRAACVGIQCPSHAHIDLWLRMQEWQGVGSARRCDTLRLLNCCLGSPCNALLRDKAALNMHLERITIQRSV